VAVKKKTKDKDKDPVKVPSTKSKNTLGIESTPRSVVDRTAKTRTGGADAIEAQQALGTVAPVVAADRPEGGEPYISEQMKLYNAWLKKQKDKALGGGGGSTALTEAQKLANKLAALKIQAEYDKADREAQKVLDDREASALEKQEATAERQRKFAALSEVANVYASQGAETDALYGGQLEDLPSRRQDDLDALLQAVSAGKETITGAENQFLSSLVAPQAYSDVPLVDFSTAQPVNPLMGALGAEGADAAGVTGQSAMDAQLAAQYAQLARGSAKQLNTGSQNYLAALRNAGTGAAAAGRQQLGMGQNMYQNQINTKYSDLTNQLAMQRLQAQQEAAARTAQAQADAAQYGETPKTVPPTETTEDDDGSAAAAAAAAEAERKKREREAAIAALNAARRNQF
jgi:hypothetical protein